MRPATPVPLVAQPNAGKGRLVDKRLVYDMQPARFAEGIEECVRAGALLVGGCCGTSPTHIEAMVESAGGTQSRSGPMDR
jgi:methionine synthase I (cobalamin-dependent)